MGRCIALRQARPCGASASGVKVWCCTWLGAGLGLGLGLGVGLGLGLGLGPRLRLGLGSRVGVGAGLGVVLHLRAHAVRLSDTRGTVPRLPLACLGLGLGLR